MAYRLALFSILIGLLVSTQACGSDPDVADDKNSGTADDDDGDDDDDVVEDDDDARDAGVRRDSGSMGGRIDGGGARVDASAPRLDGSARAPDASAPLLDGSSRAPDGQAPQSDARVDSDARAPEPDGGAVDPQRPKPKCVKKDSQVIVIGDSYINWITHTFPEDIVRESGQKWRMDAVGGQAMATGSAGLIPQQFDDSIARDPDAHTILMDGGGNDLLVGDTMRQCRDAKAPTVPFCQKIVADALAAADKLLDRAVTAGIRDVVYFYYPRVPKGTLLGGPDPNVMLDYSLPMVRDFCEKSEQRTGGKLRCYFVDMVPVFAGKPESEWFFPGDIHPTSVGSQAMAKAIWANMKQNCVAQKPEAGCCEP
jgi:hypothetical protein